MRLLALAFLASLLVACGGDSTFTVKGTLAITDTSSVVNEPVGSSGCEGSSGYDDLASGANVVIHDADGKKVALGLLMPGKLQDDGSCEFSFEVEDVPDSGDLYAVAIGHRDPYDFKQSEAGSLALSIG